MTERRISVVIACTHGADQVGRILAALDGQTLRKLTEVILVGDGDLGPLREVAAAHDARVVAATGSSLAAWWNSGWREARSPLVAFTHEVCRPRPDWLARLVTTFAEHPRAAGVGGAVVLNGMDSFALRFLQRNSPDAPLERNLLDSARLVDRLWLYLRRCAGVDHVSGSRPVASLVSANMAYRVDALLAVGGFDERFDEGAEEDLCRRLQVEAAAERDEPAEPSVLWFSPVALVDHDDRPDLRESLRRSRRSGREKARMFMAHSSEQNPVIYPLPFLVAGLAVRAAVRRSPGTSVVAAALPVMLFSRWLRAALRGRDPELLLYPYVELAQETYSNIGMAETLVRERSRFSRTRGDG